MRYFYINTHRPLSCGICGQLNSPDGFVHMHRTHDEHVFIYVTEGELHITSAGAEHAVGPGQFIFLKAGEEHFGHRASAGRLSYFWVHFADRGDVLEREPAAEKFTGDYLFPEEGNILYTDRVSLLFHQLIDISLEKEGIHKNMLDYSVSLLLMEVSRPYLESAPAKAAPPEVIRKATEWIKQHYFEPFTVRQLAEVLGYQADYLSGLFKRSMGVSIVHYTNDIRVRTAKNLLGNMNLTVKETAFSCGFRDEKYFMKVFKQMEGMTPGAYREAFNRRERDV